MNNAQPTVRELSKRQLSERLAKAKELEAITRAAYNGEWRRDPTAKNYPKVDRKLDAYNEAQTQREALEAEVLRRELRS